MVPDSKRNRQGGVDKFLLNALHVIEHSQVSHLPATNWDCGILQRTSVSIEIEHRQVLLFGMDDVRHVTYVAFTVDSLEASCILLKKKIYTSFQLYFAQRTLSL